MLRGVGRVRAEVSRIGRAVRRAWLPIISVTTIHVVGVIAGIVMVHTGSTLALGYRDKLVGRATTTDPVSLAYQQQHRLQAALIETGRTLWANIATSVTGLTIVSPYALGAYRGWVGGIVSVDGNHVSRLFDLRQAAYYLSVVILQLIPYSLTAGAGVSLGLAYFRPQTYYQGTKWLGYPVDAIWDWLRVLAIAIPFIVIANFWEFLSTLNS